MSDKPTYEELERRVKELEKLEPERKQAEEELQDAKQKWMSLIENTNDFIMIIDDKGKIQYINRAIPPHTVTQATGKTLYDFSAPENHEMIRQAVARVFETRKQESYTSSVKHPTGIQWFETTMVPIIEEGKVSSAMSFNKIITERKQAEEALRKAHDELEMRVEERTAELVSTNEKLKKEINERQKSEEALQESEEKYRSLFQGATNPITIIDKEGIIIMLNDAGARQLNLPQHACVGKSVFEEIPNLDESYYEVYRQVIDTGKEVTREDFVELPSGFRWFWSILQPVSDINGKRYGVQAISYDITERKEAEEALKKSKEKYHAIFENIQDIYFESSLDGVILELSPSVENISKYTRDELIGESVSYIYTNPYDRDQLIKAVFAKGKVSDHEVNLTDKDGSQKPSSVNALLIVDEQGNPLKFVGSIRDISERKRAEKALQESEKRYRNLVEEQSELICRYTSDWKLTFANEAYCQYFGKRSEELIGTSFMRLLPVEDRQKVAQRHHALLSSDLKQLVHEHQVIDGKGEIRWQQWVNRALFDRNGLLKEYQSVGRDITGLKKTETELKTSIKEKELLLQEVHHRVKNNFEIVSSLIDMSSMHKENQEVQNLCKNAQARIHSMALIHTQLYQTDRFDQVDMESHIQELVGHLSQVYAENAKLITTMIEPSETYLSLNQAIPCALVLNELITNAFKHAFQEQEKGTVYISINNSTGNTIQISVKDDGRGIPEGVDLSNATGLGLKLTKQLIVGQLKGEMRVNIDNGTEFQIEFKKVE